MSFLYETHLHTCQGSACGTSTGAEHARYYKEIGYQGIIVTDHFFHGNTAVPRNLPWKERVEWFCSGYEDLATSSRWAARRRPSPRASRPRPRSSGRWASST